MYIDLSSYFQFCQTKEEVEEVSKAIIREAVKIKATMNALGNLKGDKTYEF